MQKFDWDKFKTEKIAVHCKTEEEAKDFCKKMHEQGMKWRCGDSYLKYTNYDVYPEKICYYADGEHSSLKFAYEHSFTILEWSDYMQKEFTKTDLKDWMIVETKGKCRYIVLGNKFVNNDGYDLIDTYTDCLKENKYHKVEYDIVKVFKVKFERVYRLGHLFDDDNLELIWERKETKHMTTEEMRQKLEELTGEKIKAEPSKEEMVGACYEFCRNYPVMLCNGCPLCEVKNCNFEELTNDELKEAYKKVIANGK